LANAGKANIVGFAKHASNDESRQINDQRQCTDTIWMAVREVIGVP
jgi:hypothetical protein